jgi:hypothetical protein
MKASRDNVQLLEQIAATKEIGFKKVDLRKAVLSLAQDRVMYKTASFPSEYLSTHLLSILILFHHHHITHPQ